MDPAGDLNSVLVVGGCGFVGFHIVSHFLQEPSCTSVSVISRNPTSNTLPNVSYHSSDIQDLASLRTLLSKIRPRVIVHAACPPATTGTAQIYEAVTVHGTQNLLTAASETSTVRAFIFTSSATMAAGKEHIDLPESAPLADTVPGSHPYARTKATADKLVLAANARFKDAGLALRTACIRLPIVYGERDPLAVPGALEALRKGQTNVLLGDGSNLWDFTSADNAASAHVLLAKALLKRELSAPKVDGEAFNITDGERHGFWEFPRAIWKAAGHEVKAEKMFSIPTSVCLFLARFLEWLFWVFTFGTRRPNQLGMQQVEYSCFTHTYRLEKAIERLGYKPVPNFEDGIVASVRWSLEEDGWAEKLGKRGKKE
ncbi:hypothetical protein MMC19_003710 [Ptychographa xylographoides]|nr:hypothetical protein [Ptychographa xylographoides]